MANATTKKSAKKTTPKEPAPNTQNPKTRRAVGGKSIVIARRIEHVLEEIANLTWTQLRAKELAKEWNVSVNTVNQYRIAGLEALAEDRASLGENLNIEAYVRRIQHESKEARKSGDTMTAWRYAKLEAAVLGYDKTLAERSRDAKQVSITIVDPGDV